MPNRLQFSTLACGVIHLLCTAQCLAVVLSTVDFQHLLLPTDLFFSELCNSARSPVLAWPLIQLHNLRNSRCSIRLVVGVFVVLGSQGIEGDPLNLTSASKLLSNLFQSSVIRRNRDWVLAFLSSLYCVCYVSGTPAVFMAF